MRTLLFIIAFPVVLGFALAKFVPDLDTEQAVKSPNTAAIVFRAGSSKEWLEDDRGNCIHAVLRKSE